MQIDLNCDLGEGIGNDLAIMPFITSANIACGYHAGNDEIMKRTIDLALENKLQIGAHPGYPDPENFGRLPMFLNAEELENCVSDQLFKLKEMVEKAGGKLSHVKPHGAMYNQSATDTSIATTIAKAIYKIDASLLLYGLANSASLSEGENMGLQTVSEVFGDRAYSDKGLLVPRSVLGSVIHNSSLCKERVLEMVMKGKVRSISGKPIKISADTVCIHGDNPEAIALAKAINDFLHENGIQLLAPKYRL